MKQLNKIIFTGFFITVLFSCLWFNVESDNLSDKMIRLHVKANSNTDYDQQIKLIVKDSVNEFTEKLMKNSSSLEEARDIIVENLDKIENIANEKLVELDTRYSAVASFDTGFFPTREYDTFTLPAGEYISLNILIGDALGENWWCVVFPTLCSSTAIETDFDDTLSESEQEIITETPKIKFKLYEIYMDILNFFQGSKQ